MQMSGVWNLVWQHPWMALPHPRQTLRRSWTMTIERFNHLLVEGPLHGTQRLAEALKYEVDGCGKQGELMLEAWCEIQAEADRNDGEKEDENA